MRMRITEYLDAELEHEKWVCNRCDAELGPLDRSYKEGCLLRERDPREVHLPVGSDPEFNFSFDPEWIRIVEFYCPSCGTMVENEYLPPGHPLTWDIEFDIEDLKRKKHPTAAKTLGQIKEHEWAAALSKAYSR